ncbi:CysS/YqeB C-terminal domain-containing protein [Bacillus pacificus]
MNVGMQLEKEIIKKAKNLKMDLNELGIVVKDRNEEQYVREI